VNATDGDEIYIWRNEETDWCKVMSANRDEENEEEEMFVLWSEASDDE